MEEYERLNISNKKDLKNILIAIYNKEDDSFVVHYKQDKK